MGLPTSGSLMERSWRPPPALISCLMTAAASKGSTSWPSGRQACPGVSFEFYSLLPGAVWTVRMFQCARVFLQGAWQVERYCGLVTVHMIKECLALSANW